MAHGNGIFTVSFLHTGDFGGILAGFRQQTGIRLLQQLRPILLQLQRTGGIGTGAVEPDTERIFPQTLQDIVQFVCRIDGNVIADMSAELAVQPAWFDKQIQRGIAV